MLPYYRLLKGALVFALSLYCQQLLGKTYGLRCKNKVMISDFDAFMKIKICR